MSIAEITEPTIALQQAFASRLPELSRPVQPAPLSDVRLLALNDALAQSLGLDPTALRDDAGVRTLSGQRFPEGSHPVAQAYAGHQWGVFKPVLGDGRALLLGELRGLDGHWYDLHLKGTGPTDFSRVDGYALVGPMLREYLFGEAMQALGVPTTRALAVVATGATHVRDDIELPGAVLARVARSHLRIGSFQFVPGTGDLGLLQRLADFAIERLYPQAADATHPYRALFTAVIDAHAELTAQWIRLGFVHGVLSTDNVTISGETIDYGPCAFIDRYEPGIWYSSIDQHGRYAYERQPEIMAWNLTKLGEALAPLLADDPKDAYAFIEESVHRYSARYRQHRFEAFRAKLGVSAADSAPADVELVSTLIDEVLDLLALHRVDFTGFFRDLAAAAEGDSNPVRARFESILGVSAVNAWLTRWLALKPSAQQIRAVNPRYIPRNHLVDAALADATAGNLESFRALLEVVSHPYDEQDVDPAFAEPGPEGVRHRTFCGT